MKAAFTQSDFCVLTCIRSKECAQTTDFPPSLDSSPSTHFQGWGPARERLVPTLLEQAPPSGHRWHCRGRPPSLGASVANRPAGLFSKATIYSQLGCEIAGGHWRSNLFHLNVWLVHYCLPFHTARLRWCPEVMSRSVTGKQFLWSSKTKTVKETPALKETGWV